MTQVIAEISISLDGFVTGPNPGITNGLGDGGMPIHDWVFDEDSAVDQQVLKDSVDVTGAVIMGKRTFEIVDGPGGWNDEMGYGATHAAPPPVFVVTHHVPESVRLGPRFSFVTDGLTSAIEQARSAAGDKAVVIMGGGAVVCQAVSQRLADELVLHISPIVMGGGTPLFEGIDLQQLERLSAIVSPNAVHVRYRVR